MTHQNNLFRSYLDIAPLPLAIERCWECELLSTRNFEHPILDVGCGEGVFAKNLVNQNIDVGIDPNPREIKRAEKYQVYNELIRCSGDNVPKKNGEFHTIFSNSVLEHIPNIESVLVEMRRLLSDTGVIYLTLPTDKFDKYSCGYQILTKLGLKKLAASYVNVFNRFWNHSHYYCGEDWESLFQNCGFSVIDQVEYGSVNQCLLNNFISPFCLFSFVVKKISNHWFFFPRIRSVVSRLVLSRLFAKTSMLDRQPRGTGGLIFFAIEKHK